MTPSADALVIGGGHNGLVAAGYLARAGLHVLLLEQREIVGGLTTTEEIFPGFRAEPASQIAHGVEPRIFRDMRLQDYKIEAVRPDPYLVMPFPNGERFVGWRRGSRLREEIAKFSLSDADAWFEHRTVINELAEDLGFSPLEPPPTIQEMINRVAGSRHEAVFHELVFGTIAGYFDARFESEEVKSVLSLLASAFNLCGPMSSSAYLMVHWALPVNSKLEYSDAEDIEFRGGTLRTKGGIGSITQAMADSIIDDGVEVRTGCRVERILVESGRARGVRLASGEEIRADAIVSNADPKATLLHMVGEDNLDPMFARDLGRVARNGSASKFIMAFDGVPEFAAARDPDENFKFLRSSFRFAPTMEYQERAFDDAKYGVPSRRPVIYGQCPTAIDPELAPPDHHMIALTVFHAPYRLRSGTWATMSPRFSEQIIETVEEYIPNVRSILRHHRLFTPADIERRVGALGGSPTHGEMTIHRLLGLTPKPNWADSSTPIGGLYIGGAGAWPGGAVTGGPGHNAAMRVIRDLAPNRESGVARRSAR